MPNSERNQFSDIPIDFPRPVHMGALPGGQPKVLAVMYEGKFYIPGCTPPEMSERVNLCNDLISRILTRIKEIQDASPTDASRKEILSDYMTRLNSARWTSQSEARWIIRKVAVHLGWPAPSEAAE